MGTRGGRSGGGIVPGTGRLELRAATVFFAFAVLALALGAGQVVAHWALRVGVSAGANTGSVDAVAGGNLTFDFPGCTPGIESRSCDKFDADVIGSAPLSSETSGVTFTITGWVYKDGDLTEAVGFYYTITGGTVEIGVKSGQNYDETTLGEGSGFWLNPACTGDPGPGGAVTCTPRNTRAISHISFCLVKSSPPGCPEPLTQAVLVDNVGSIPFALESWLSNPAAAGADYCDVFELTIRRVIDGSALDPAHYRGPLCGLLGVPAPLAEQIDPGASATYEVTLGFAATTSEFNGTSGGFTAGLLAGQWNDSGGWTERVDLPLLISVGSAPTFASNTADLPGAGAATLAGETVAAAVGGPVPAVIDVLGRSTVTITSWLTDPNDDAVVLGFRFTVSGDPVSVEVKRGANGWVDERREDENPHLWHDPYGVVSEAATAITSIEFGVVALPDELPGEEPLGEDLTENEPPEDESQGEPPGEEPPAEEPPADPSQGQEPPGEAPPGDEPPTGEPPGEEPPTEGPAAEESPAPASLSGVVWLDENGDGIRQATEAGSAGVIVRLLDDLGKVAATTTDADGAYVFTDLAPGEFSVEIESPAGYRFTAAGLGSDPDLDSDVTAIDPGSLVGRVLVSLTSGANAGTADAGLVLEVGT